MSANSRGFVTMVLLIVAQAEALLGRTSMNCFLPCCSRSSVDHILRFSLVAENLTTRLGSNSHSGSARIGELGDTQVAVFLLLLMLEVDTT